MGLLDGGIRDLFNAAFAGLYLDGLLHGGTGDPIYVGARITGYTSGGDRAVKVQTDTTSDTIKSADGYAEGDVTLIVLAGDGSWAITTNSELTDGFGKRYRIQDVDQDAARSHWICRGRPL